MGDGDLIVKVVSTELVKSIAPFFLEFEDLLIFSATAFTEIGLQEKLEAIARASDTSYYISHGVFFDFEG